MKLKYRILIGFAIVVVLSNIHPGPGIFRLFFDEGLYRYSNSNGSMTFEEIKFGQFPTAQRRHTACLLSQPDLKDKQLYRLFSKNPLAFWRWRLYFTEEKYKLPYKNWKEIKRLRTRVNAPYCIAEF